MGAHRMGELEDELLRSFERRGHGAGEVGQPVCKVEGHVSTRGAALRDERLEFGEERAGRRLALYEPAMVEGHLALRELDRPLLRVAQRMEGGQDGRVVLEHV
jgi:hypothetical protein